MVTDDRFLIALEQFDNARMRLKNALDQPETEYLRDSVIQRFEFTFECAWKAMYRWLRARGNAVDEEAYEVLPLAFTLRLIVDEAGWGEMRKMRNLTSHTYNEPLAIKVAAFVRAKGAPLFEELAATLRSRSK